MSKLFNCDWESPFLKTFLDEIIEFFDQRVTWFHENSFKFWKLQMHLASAATSKKGKNVFDAEINFCQRAQLSTANTWAVKYVPKT